MLTIVRILMTVALGYGVYRAAENARLDPEAGDLTNAFWLSYCVVVGFVTALTWAPLIAERVAEPMTSALTDGAVVKEQNHLMRWIRRLEGRGQRWLVRWLCFVEGVRHPWLPAQFVTGMNNARPGSWLERVFAREVYRFNNTRHCVQAYQVLKRHGLTPPLHPNNEINLVLLSIEKEIRPPAPPLAVPPGEPPSPVRRNVRIKLFAGAETRGAQPAEPAAERPAEPATGPRAEAAEPGPRRPRTPFRAPDEAEADGREGRGG
ncbi:MAG: hypothetical protein FJ387_29880 [Verrucomicrobia bacterium]|nr:hypothetical protein [Verrucomicrobiota bacterium]